MSLRPELRLRALRVPDLLRLHEAIAGRTVARVEAHALLQILMPERARFVRLARQRGATEADAEDIVQRALSRAADGAASLDDSTKARAWFYRILRRAIVDHRRVGASDPMTRQTDTDLDELPNEHVEPTQSTCA